MIEIVMILTSANGPARDRVLGTADIVNDGTGGLRVGNYDVYLRRGPRSKTRIARVEGFARSSKSAWELLRLALNALAEKGELP